MKRRTILCRAFALLGGFFLAVVVNAATMKDDAKFCAGYGLCRFRSCDCYRFVGKGNTCKCGHSFYDHR